MPAEGSGDRAGAGAGGGPVSSTRTHAGSSTGATPAAAPAPHPLAPTQVRDPDRYALLGEHGRGGLGKVSRAHDRELGRDVAIKELLTRGDVNELRFLREALITARLEHPGIVPVHEAGRWPDGTPFYAMKLVAGRSLRALLAERATADERIALLHHVIAVADAIAYAHDRNIIHRDLKPANIVVGDFGETIVIDWGLAKDLTAGEDEPVGPGGASPRDVTAAGSVIGTPRYMAPEQARGEAVDKRADVFSIGAMLWELCAQRDQPPPDAAARHAALRRAGVDDDLVAIIDKAIDPDPARRYPDAGALAADLKAFKAGARIAARSYSPYARLVHWTRRHRAAALAALAFVVLAVSGVTALAVLYRASSKNAATAQERLVRSYREQGRRLLVDGEYLRALPYLAEAYAEGDRSNALGVMLARAERHADAELAVHVHAGSPRAAAFRPGGAHVLSISDDGEAAVWDAATGETIARLPGATAPATPGRPAVRRYGKVSRDGAFAALPLAAGVVVWDGATARTIGPPSPERLAIAPDGARVAVMAGTALSVWRVATGERAWAATLAVPAIQLAFSGDAVAVLGVDQRVRLVRADAVVELDTSFTVGTFTVAPGGAIAAVVDRAIELWEGGHRRATVAGHGSNITALAFSADGGTLAVGSEDGLVRLHAAATGDALADLAGHRGRVQSLEFSDDGERLASTASDLAVRIWSVADHHPIAQLVGARDQVVVNALRFDATGQRVVAPTLGAIHVFAAGDPDAALAIDARDDLEYGRLLADGRRFATGGAHAFQLWSLATGAPLASIATPPEAQMVLSPDETMIASFRQQKVQDVELRAVATGAVVARIHPTERTVGAAFDRAGARLATASSEGVIELWTARGAPIATLRGHRGVASAVAFSPDDRHLASASHDGTIAIWDLDPAALAAGRPVRVLTGGGQIASVAFDATGARLVTSGSERLVRLYDVATGAQLRSLEHPAALLDAAISPDGALIAGATLDGTVSLWDVETSSLLAQFRHTTRATHVDFARDRLLSTSSDGSAIAWRLGREVRPAAAVTSFVRCHAPYKLVDTRLEAAPPVCAPGRR